jgi:hypothetical protein
VIRGEWPMQRSPLFFWICPDFVGPVTKVAVPKL